MIFKSFFLTIITFLILLLPGYAQDSDVQDFTVRIIYFLPKDREPQPNIDAKIDKLIKRVQKFYADEMERHGFGRKTFQLETNEAGNAVVHHVIGEHNDKRYLNASWMTWGPIYKKFKRSKTVFFNVIDFSSERTRPGSCGEGQGGIDGGRVLIPASGVCFRLDVAAHELGHAFGLPHDWRSNSHIMSYGRGRNRISFCAAQWLDVHPFFNTNRIAAVKRMSETPPNIKVLKVIKYPSNILYTYLKATDADGLHHTQFQTRATPSSGLSMQACLPLNGESDFIQFTSSGGDVLLTALDVYGNVSPKWIPFKDNKPDMILNISPGDDRGQNGLIGHWAFDEAQGRFAFSSSGKDKYALLGAGANLQLNSGKIGGALELNGRRGAILPNGMDLINGLQAFTIAFWVKSDEVGTDKGFIFPKFPNDKDEVFSIRYDADGQEGGGNNVIKAGITTPGGVQTYESASDMQTTEWQHIALTWQSGQELTLYINGVLDKPTFNSVATEGEITGAETLIIGRGCKDRSGSFNGLIDDVRLYNRVLGEKEIADLSLITAHDDPVYGIALAGVADISAKQIDTSKDVKFLFTVTNTGNTEDTVKLELSDNVVGTLSQHSVTLAPQTSSIVTLTIDGTSLTTAGERLSKVTATSEGDNTKIAKINAKVTIPPVYSFTLAGVGKMTTEVANTSENVEYSLKVTNNSNTEDTIKLTTSGDAKSTLSKTSLLLGTKASETVKLTLPKDSLGTDTDYIVKVTATSEGDNTKTLHLTTITTGHSGSNPTIDLQDGLVGHWAFDEDVGNIASDMSENKNNATLDSIGNIWKPNSGKINGALQLDGSGGASVADGGNVINALEAFTITFWIKLDEIGTPQPHLPDNLTIPFWIKQEQVDTDNGCIFSPKDPNGKDSVFTVRYDTKGKNGGGSNIITASIATIGGIQNYESTSDVQTTEWQHIALTWRSGRELTLYINGVLDQPTFNSPSTHGEVIEAEKLIIGRGGKNTNSALKGLIDDVRLYNRVLSSGEIADLVKVNATTHIPEQLND